jgi:2-(1,2-epoxy-1,2-dihydrophenyl)acetyl-CoA isomerase
MSNTVITEIHGAVLTITLNRPERLNPLNRALLTALSAAFDEAAAPDIRAVLLTGAGRGFCTGADLTQDFGPNPDLGDELDKYYTPLVLKMQALPKPIIAAVNGPAAGAGMNLALTADIVIAARSATFTQGFIRIGLLPDAGGSYFLPRLVGDMRARTMAMLGETFSAEQAQALGVVWQVFDDEVFATEALTMATNLAAKPPLAMAAIKRVLASSAQNTLAAQLDLERDAQSALGRTADFVEGVTAFMQKRPAVFKGK